MMTRLFQPIRKAGKLVAKDVNTGEIETELIRYAQLNSAEKLGMYIQYDVESGKQRKVNMTRQVKQQMADAGKMNFANVLEQRDPAIMFSNLERLTKMVGRNIQPSLVVTGMAGMGKTHIVKQTLTDMGLKESTDFVHFKGRATAAGLFVTLYENSDKCIIFDDCDSIFKDDDAVNILKAALDSYDTRRISYISTKPLKDAYDNPVPRHFEFTGQVIFISNISQAKLDEAVKSRSFVADIAMSTSQMFQRMEQLLPNIERTIPAEAKHAALQYMKELDSEFAGVEINLRSFIKAARICALGFEDPKGMIAEQIIPA